MWFFFFFFALRIYRLETMIRFIKYIFDGILSFYYQLQVHLLLLMDADKVIDIIFPFSCSFITRHA
jgi:hypothetical protein